MTWTTFCNGLRDAADSKPLPPDVGVTLTKLRMITGDKTLPPVLTPLGWLWLGRVTDQAPARELEAYAAAFGRALDHIRHATHEGNRS